MYSMSSSAHEKVQKRKPARYDCIAADAWACSAVQLFMQICKRRKRRKSHCKLEGGLFPTPVWEKNALELAQKNFIVFSHTLRHLIRNCFCFCPACMISLQSCFLFAVNRGWRCKKQKITVSLCIRQNFAEIAADHDDVTFLAVLCTRRQAPNSFAKTQSTFAYYFHFPIWRHQHINADADCLFPAKRQKKFGYFAYGMRRLLQVRAGMSKRFANSAIQKKSREVFHWMSQQQGNVPERGKRKQRSVAFGREREQENFLHPRHTSTLK